MKKIHIFLLICISLAGTSLLVGKLFSTLNENPKIQLPPNLSRFVSAREIDLPFSVPILMYHHIRQDPGSEASIVVSPQNFESQLQWISAHDFQTVDLDYFTNPTALAKKPLILTFDDGYEDMYTNAFPILKKYNFTATFYLITNNIDKSGFLTTNQILEMQRSGMHFGSHSLSHPNLTTISQQQAEEEIYASKKILEQKIGTSVADFCFPGGTLNNNIEFIVANSGYTTATTTINKTNLGKVDTLKLNRLDIRNDTDFENLLELR